MFLDEHPENCEGVVALIRAQQGYRVIVASAMLEAAIQAVQDAKPDVVLLNLESGGPRLALAGALHGAVPKSRVIIMSVTPADEDIPALVQARVSGFVMADATFDRFLYTVHSVVRGTQVLPPALAAALFRHLNPHGDRRRPKRSLDLRRLTGREREVAALIVRGISNREIAIQLRITLHTVKSHVHRVLAKLAMKSRLEVASFFHDSVVSPGDERPAMALSTPLDLAPISLV